MQSINAYMPKENTFFTATVQDGTRRAHGGGNNLLTELYLRVEAAALPIIAAIDTAVQATLAAIQALIGLCTFDSFPSLGTIKSAIDHIQLAGQSFLAIPVAITAAIQALVDPTASFDRMSEAIKKPASI